MDNRPPGRCFSARDFGLKLCKFFVRRFDFEVWTGFRPAKFAFQHFNFGVRAPDMKFD